MKTKYGLLKEQILNELFVKNINDIDTVEEGLRLAIISEYDAVNLYKRLADMIDDEEISENLLEIAGDEEEHIGQLTFLLRSIDPDFSENEQEGVDEAIDIISGEEDDDDEDEENDGDLVDRILDADIDDEY